MQQINESFVIVLLSKIGCTFCERIKIILPLHRKLIREKYPTLNITILQFDKDYHIMAPHPFVNINVLHKLSSLWTPMFLFCSSTIWQKIVQHKANEDISWTWSDIHIFDTEWNKINNTWIKLNYNSMYDPHHIFNWVVNCQQRMYNENITVDVKNKQDTSNDNELEVLLPALVNLPRINTVDKICNASNYSDNVCYADLHCRWKKPIVQQHKFVATRNSAYLDNSENN